MARAPAGTGPQSGDDLGASDLQRRGSLTWYTSLAGDSYKAMIKAFETKYPGVKIEAYRVSGSDITTRMFEESKAKRYIADTVETTEGNLMFMRDAFLLRPYHSPHFSSYPEEAKEKGERGLYFWAIARESYVGFAYNKNLLSKGAVPKNFEGLLHPELKGAWVYRSAIQSTK